MICGRIAHMLQIGNYKISIFVFIALLLAVLGAALVYKLINLQVVQVENEVLTKEVEGLNVRLQDLEDMLAQRDESLEVHKELLASVQGELRKTGQSRFQLDRALRDATMAADTFNKLNNTDKELLAKYSKVYFLNEHYSPKNLADIESEWTWQGGSIKVRQEVVAFLTDMLSNMKADGLDPKIVSAYRSFGTQETLKNTHKVNYGTTEANKFVADQGFSEHQLGTTVDITDAATGGLRGFENSDEGKWLVENAYKYGFTLSYPDGNAYYAYEPWHWRFVGTALAEYLHEEGKYFYDLPQREINKYLITIFGK